MAMCVRRQYDIVNTKERVLPDCDKPYHSNKQNYRKGRRFEFCETMHSFHQFIVFLYTRI